MPDGYGTGSGGMLYCNQTFILSGRVGSGSGHKTIVLVKLPVQSKIHSNQIHCKTSALGSSQFNSTLSGNNWIKYKTSATNLSNLLGEASVQSEQACICCLFEHKSSSSIVLVHICDDNQLQDFSHKLVWSTWGSQCPSRQLSLNTSSIVLVHISGDSWTTRFQPQTCLIYLGKPVSKQATLFEHIIHSSCPYKWW